MNVTRWAVYLGLLSTWTISSAAEDLAAPVEAGDPAVAMAAHADSEQEEGRADEKQAQRGIAWKRIDGEMMRVVTNMQRAPSVDIDFEGGSVADFYDQLLEQMHFNVLIRGEGDHDQQVLDSIKFKQVPLRDAVYLPDHLSEAVRVQLRGSYVIVRVSPDERPAQAVSRFDLDFAGGTLDDLAEAVRDAQPRANIIIMQTARDFELPAFKLRNVTAVEVFRVLDSYVPDPSRRLSIEVLKPEVEGDIGSGVQPQPLIRVEVQHHSRRGRGEQSQPPVQQMVWSTAELELESAVSTDVLHGAIDAALELAGSEAEVRYHPGAKLLIARGTDDDLLLIDSVLKQVKTSAVWIGQPKGE